MGKGLEDFDYDTIAEMLNNVSFIKDNTKRLCDLQTISIIINAVLLLVIIFK